MKPRLIIHAGMHKTGSTSIQHWLRNASLDDAHYFNWKQDNHSTLFTLLFEENPYEYFALKRRGFTAENYRHRRNKARRALIAEIEDTPVSTFIFSAERISSASDASVEKLHRFFSKHFQRIDVYAYVRQPTGFMTSMFQQHLKTWNSDLGFKHLWPAYQRRFDRIDRVYGQSEVHLRLYEDLRNRQTDSVSDFLEWTGVSGEGEQAVRRNTSMSSDAVALLYFYRKYVVVTLDQRLPPKFDNRLVQAIRQIKGERFELSLPSDPEFEQTRRAGIEWMSERMGIEYEDFDQGESGAVVFRTDEDLVQTAISASHKLVVGDRKLDPNAAGSFDQAVSRLETFAKQFVQSLGSDQLPVDRIGGRPDTLE